MVKLPILPGFLPNPPHKGLPTPRSWGQTWNAVEENLSKNPENILPLLGVELGGGFLGAAVGVGVGMTLVPPPLTIPVALSIMGIGVAGGLGFYGAVWEALKKEGND